MRIVYLLVVLTLFFAILAPAASDTATPALRLPFDSAQGKRSGQAPEPPKIIAYVMWDPSYLYVAARVPDPMVIGINQEPMSPAFDDDSLQIDLNLGDPYSLIPNPKTYRVVISAAGGCMIEKGNAGGEWRPDPAWLMGLKYEVRVEGTLNKGGDADQGYIIEAALPWKLMGATPQNGTIIGFNLTCFMRGESETFASWSSEIEARADLNNPSKWGRMQLRLGGQPEAAQQDAVICPSAMVSPAIDGSLAADEWMGASTITIAKPIKR